MPGNHDGDGFDREGRIARIEHRQDVNEERISKLEAFQHWIIGIGTGVGLFIGVTAKQFWAYITGHP